MPLLAGKIPVSLLSKLLRRYTGSLDSSVIIGPGVGLDAAAFRVRDGVLVSATDPVTFAPKEIGWYAVNINANDVAVMGAKPRWFLACILLPESDSGLAESIFAQIDRACKGLGIAVLGGHSEVTIGLARPIVVGTMLGEVTRKRLLSASKASVGDVLILTKGIAIEGTSILARERVAELAKAFGTEFVKRAKALLYRPGISVVKDALLAAQAGASALHDVTEGGILMGVREMALASGIGVELAEENVLILPETSRVAAHFGIDPLGLIASGALLIAACRRRVPGIIRCLEREKIPAVEIGRFVRKGFWCVRGGKRFSMRIVQRDEIVEVL